MSSYAVGSADDALALYRPGDSVSGHFRVEALLGEGGAGAVYRVRDERKGGRLALKQLRAQEGEHKALLTSQFAHEYHTLSQLAHPRIIEVYDYGVDRGCPYYTMELLDGADLHDRGKLPYRTACRLLCDVASSLAILHSRGLLHRDVSARNVRCTSDERAKLLDFGAMVPAGSVQRAVGTPPFVAPEVLQMQPLDARADLYGLGALAYWTLTGRYAYPAQTFTQLRDAWRRPLRKISELTPDVPDALVELVMSLLRLDRDDRPRTAAEVMERLSAIAGLEAQELPQVGRAYLVTPSLVGRAPVLQQARQTLLGALQGGRGAALLIEGPPGVGRSRFLDACVLEAKLMGAVVLRGSAADAVQGEYGVTRALLAQLLESCRDVAERAARPRAALLVQVFPALAPDVAPSGDAERRHVQAALRDFFLTVARTKHVVIAADDVSAFDEPSTALLGALAHGTQRRRLTLLWTGLLGADTTQALEVLRELSARIVLEPLDVAQVEELLRSLFGDSPRIAALAARLYPQCGGSPRELMRLAEHLVTQGLARYESGGWVLPSELSDDELPRSNRVALERRIAALSADARGLAEVLAWTDVRALSLAQYAQLSDHGDGARTFHALDELVRAGLLVGEGERYRPSANDALAPLAESLSAERAQALHARLARVLPLERRSPTRLLHLLRGGQELEAIGELLSGPPDELYAGRLEALVTAAEAAERLGLPVLTRLELQYRIARVSALAIRPELFERFGWTLIERLRRDSGLLDYHELDASLAEVERLSQSQRRAQERYDAQPAEARGFTPSESMLRLVALHGSGAALAGSGLDLEQLERLGSLGPWVNLSRAIRLVQLGVDSAIETHSGRLADALRSRASVMEQLDEPGAVNPATARAMRLAYVNGLACDLAVTANPSCQDWIEKLDGEPGHRGNAWRYRMLYALALGKLMHASDYERRAELLDLQDAGGLRRPRLTAAFEMALCIIADDLSGLRNAAQRLAEGARRFPRWRVPLSITQAEHMRLQSDPQGALLALDEALRTTAAGRHPGWSWARGVQLRLLLMVDRVQEAADLAAQYLEQCERLSITDRSLLKGAAADAFTAAGRVAEALRYAEENLAEHQSDGIHGTRLGLAYEVRARVANAMRDAGTFASCAERCGKLYLLGRSPGLRARHERLLQAAASVGLVVESPSGTGEAVPAPNTPIEDAARTVYSRMLTCISANERAERALQLLLEATGARTGYFYGLRGGKLSLLFNPEADAPASGLAGVLEDCLDELGASGASSRTPLGAQPIAPAERFIDSQGRTFEPLVLAGMHDGEAMIAGIAALHFPDEDERPAPRRAVVDAVIDALISEDVVDPITCVT